MSVSWADESMHSACVSTVRGGKTSCKHQAPVPLTACSQPCCTWKQAGPAVASARPPQHLIASPVFTTNWQPRLAQAMFMSSATFSCSRPPAGWASGGPVH